MVITDRAANPLMPSKLSTANKFPACRVAERGDAVASPPPQTEIQTSYLALSFRIF